METTQIGQGENELLDSLRQGEEYALRDIIKQHMHTLRYYAWTLVKDRETAEEIANDAFTKLWQARERFGSLLEVKRFLYRVAKNASLDHLKSARVKYGRATGEADGVAGNEPDLEARFIQAELMEAIYREIENLPDKQRDVFRLSFLEGFTAGEISERLGITLNAVYLNKSLATKTLQKVFRNSDFLLYLCFLACFGEG